MAVQLLGELKSKAALPRFKAMLNTENDLYLLREVLTALENVGSSESRAVLCEPTQHESRIVRNFAKLLMDGGTG